MSEFQINSYTNNSQSNPSITNLADGGFIVMWDGEGQGGIWGIHGQRFNADGSQRGSEFFVSEGTGPKIAELADGSFVVTWRDYVLEDNDYNAYAQHYNADGSARGEIFQVNTYMDNSQAPSSIANLTDGGFVITWDSRDQDGSGYGVFGQCYNADGTTNGNEFQVNTYTDNNQAGSLVTGLSDGGFVVTWSSLGDGSGWGIFGQRYNADGTVNGGEFQINTYTSSEQDSPSLTNLSDGGFVVTWCSRGQDGSEGGIYGQRYNADGTTNGDEFQINTYTENWQWNPSVTDLADGGFVVTWGSYEQDGSRSGIYGQRYNADGTVNGDEFQINTYTDNSQNNPSVTGLADGGFIVTWDSLDQDGDSWGIYGQRYNADGDPVDLQVNLIPVAQDDVFYALEDTPITGNVLSDNGNGVDADPEGETLTVQAGALTTVNGGNVALNADGTFTYTPAEDFSGQDSFEYTVSDGEQTDTATVTLNITAVNDSQGEFRVNTYTPGNQINSSVTGLADGGFIVTWDSSNEDPNTSGLDIYAQRYNADGSPGGEEFLVNTYTSRGQTNPSVTNLADGGFIVTWRSRIVETSDYNTHGQRYNADGSKYGEEFQVNTYTDEYQGEPVVADLADGGFVITWDSHEQDGDDYGAYGQIYNADGTTRGSEFRVNTHTEGAQHIGSVTGLAGGGFIVTWSGNTSDGYGHFAQLYNADGTTNGDEIETAGSESLTSLPDGGFVITWGEFLEELSDHGIFGQVYNADGSLRDDEFQINTNVEHYHQAQSATSLADGGFVITWSSRDQDGSAEGIYGQCFNVSGSPRGAEFQVNTYTDNSQHFPDVAALEDGGFIVTWQSLDQDGDEFGIYAQRYNADGEPIEQLVEYAPEAQDDTFAGLEDMPISGNVLEDNGNGADSDTNGDALSVQAANITTGNGGNVVLNTDGTFTYTPIEDFNGEDSFDYTLTDGILTDTATVTLNLTNTLEDQGEFQINTYTERGQMYSSVAGLSDGGFIVTWQSFDQVDTEHVLDVNIFGQRYNADGTKFGDEFQIDTTPPQGVNSKSHPFVTELSDSSFIVTWESYEQDGSKDGIYGQRYYGDGTKYGDEFQINTYTDDDQEKPSVAGLSDGGFVVTWQSENQDGSQSSVFGQRFNADGTTNGGEFQINTVTENFQRYPSVEGLSDGGFIVTWQSYPPGYEVYSLHSQLYNADGTTNGDEFLISASDAMSKLESPVTSLSDGGFIVIWDARGADSVNNPSGFNNDVFGQRFNADGTTNGDEFQINTYTDYIQINPSITELTDGGFVVTWTSENQDGSGFGIFGQSLNADSSPRGDEFQINTHAYDNQMYPSVASLEDGGFVVTWHSFGQDGSREGVYGQRYNADGEPIDLLIEYVAPGLVTMDAASVAGYSGGQDVTPDNFEVINSEDILPVQNNIMMMAMSTELSSGALETGDTLHLWGNTWKAMEFNYTVTKGTVLEFDFKSTSEGEIHAIGLDAGAWASKTDPIFELFGTDNYFANRIDNYDIGDGWKHYTIKIGEHYTGSVNYLTFINDHDIDSPTADSYFRDVQVYEALGLVTIDAASISTYGGTGQDVTPDNFEVLDNGDTLHLWGNTWKAMDFDYTVTKGTVLEFDYKSTAEGEIQAIGLDASLWPTTGVDPTFELFGTDNYFADRIDNYDIGDGWKHYTIKIGEHYTGDVNYLTFINDHDVDDPTADSYFRDIQVYEAPGLVTIDAASIDTYGGAAQDVTSDNLEVLDNGDILHLWGNTWKAMELSYDVKESTVIEFDFKSTSEGEIHAIGLDVGAWASKTDPIFELFGTDSYFANRIDNYDIGDGWKHYTINVGDYYTGDVNYLTFINDHDIADPTADSFFRNIQVHDLSELHGTDGDDVLLGVAGAQEIHGYGGSDTLYGGSGADTFVFDVDAFSAIDSIQDFDISEGDKLDISDVLSGYDPVDDMISNFVQITESGGNSYLSVDADGGADNFIQIASLYGVTGLAEEEELETLGDLITV